MQQTRQVLAHARNCRRVEMAEQVTPGQAQLTFADRRQRQRVVGAFMVVRQRKAQAIRRALLQRLGNREVLKHQQAVKQRLTRSPGPALHIAQRRELVLAQRQVVRLQTGQPLGHTVGGIRLADHRQRIDKQTELVFSPR